MVICVYLWGLEELLEGGVLLVVLVPAPPPHHTKAPRDVMSMPFQAGAVDTGL
jgi:hypothetical protein